MKIGDVVSLKSGGPDMTVKSVQENEIQCEWFEGVKVHERPFHPDTLNVGSLAQRQLKALEEAAASDGPPRRGRGRLIHDM